MKQTAVELFAKELNNWRIKEFGEDAIIGIPTEVINQAKAMEKQQIRKAYLADAYNSQYGFEQYYNETFKSE
jgi:hypothetical protein